MPLHIRDVLPSADVVIGAVLIKGAKRSGSRVRRTT